MDNVNLSGRAFQLGNIHYVVSHHQQYNSPVRCYREENNVVTIVHLPLVFVLEQLAVEIRLVEPG